MYVSFNQRIAIVISNKILNLLKVHSQKKNFLNYLEIELFMSQFMTLLLSHCQL